MLSAQFFTFCAFVTIGDVARFAQWTKNEIMFDFLSVTPHGNFSWVTSKIFHCPFFQFCVTNSIMFFAVADPGFTRGGGAKLWGEGVPIYDLANFLLKTAWKWKNLDREGRGAFLKDLFCPATKNIKLSKTLFQRLYCFCGIKLRWLNIYWLNIEQIHAMVSI